MPVWKPESIEHEPEVSLRNWVIYEIEGTRHFVGYNIREGSGRVSSPIVKFDKEKMIGVTRSGRVYRLIGESNYSADAHYTWYRWCNLNGFDHNSATRIDIIDAS